MNTTSEPARSLVSRASILCLLFVAAFALPPVQRAAAQSVGPAILVQNDDWEIVVSAAGYSDLLLDRRPGFLKREFLSGEWAAAVTFDKGGETIPPTWLQKQWIAPDWVSNSDFGLENNGAFTILPGQNESGFTRFQSSITNASLRVTIMLEMLDSAAGIEMGTRAKSSAEAGTSVTSSKYVLKQTYTFENISGQELTNFKFFQFLHGLESAMAVHDDRDYGGPFADYKYDITEVGDSFSFNTMNGDIVLHHDVIGLHANMLPSAFEVGYYGRPPTEDHQLGKPSIGVHLSVEADALDSTTDFFVAPETRWVSGALRFDLGTLAVDASVSRDVLLSIQTSFEQKANVQQVQLQQLTLTPDGVLVIELQDNLQGATPIPSFIALYKSTELVPFLNDSNQIATDEFGRRLWEQVPVPLINGSRFEVPVTPGDAKAFYAIAIHLDNSPPIPAGAVAPQN